MNTAAKRAGVPPVNRHTPGREENLSLSLAKELLSAFRMKYDSNWLHLLIDTEIVSSGGKSFVYNCIIVYSMGGQ